MTDLNKSFLTGRLTKDAEMTTTKDGKAIARFTLASSRGKTKDGKELTDFIGCVAFDKIAEKIGEWTKKGHRITVETRQQSGSYEKDGKTIYTHDNVVLWWQTLEKKQDGDKANNSSKPNNDQSVMDGFMDVATDDTADEVPFE